MSKVPISYIIDDGGVVNTYHFHNPNVEHPIKHTTLFPKRFAKVCREYGVRGKFSVVPMPCCLGRIDQKLVGFTKDEIERRLKIIREEISPMFSITPEVLTHLRAYDLKRDLYLHVFEDVYFSTLDAETMADYISLALEILINTGFKPTGLTSPWMCGLDNEENYSKAIGMAFVKTLAKKECFYFLHSRDGMLEPKLMQNSSKTGRVVSIPAITGDIFWRTQKPFSRSQAIKLANENVDEMLAKNGKSGKIIDLLENGKPITLITHWQSLYSDGLMIGLDGFEELTRRIKKFLSKQVEWQTFEEIAKNYL